jgi:hypothetical protein
VASQVEEQKYPLQLPLMVGETISLSSQASNLKISETGKKIHSTYLCMT